MSDLGRHDGLVEDLASHLDPVRPLPAPGSRAALWLAAAVLLGLALATRYSAAGLAVRMAVPDMALAALGAVLTAVSAAYAAFATSVPGRSAAWALLPLPAAALWIGASGLGCLRDWLVPGAPLADAGEMRGCFGFLVGVSAPLSAILVLMLRRACPLRPNLTAALAGLAAAAAAAALLVPFHPHDTTVSDLVVHAGVVAGVIGLNALAGGRVLAGRPG
ncbi:NrsF family protein [Methylobacterium sp. NEAU 140]|uniref:NrsF family protein n=1 Tax=Methylobacterium sp. NEAU 140 TaxID=3064945 RepID=UPI00273771FD|nr:NrsF family protein [Methylobacterium sp. NEAU 140]MDP4026218.1 NrsF family protein [Methylobacterium sp. NEAU 140]